jgi:hypothetical protein
MRELLVDTSAWIEWLRATGSVADQLITAAFAQGYELTIAGVILQEVLQGCRNERHTADVTHDFVTDDCPCRSCELSRESLPFPRHQLPP